MYWNKKIPSYIFSITLILPSIISCEGMNPLCATLNPLASDFTSPCKLCMFNKDGCQITKLVIVFPTLLMPWPGLEETASRVRSASTALLCVVLASLSTEGLELTVRLWTKIHVDATTFKHAVGTVCGLLVATTATPQRSCSGHRSSR